MCIVCNLNRLKTWLRCIISREDKDMTLCRSDLAPVKWWLGSTFKEPRKTGLIKPMYSCFEKSQSEAEPNIYKSQVIRKYFHSLRGWIQWKRESLGDRATQDLGVVLPGGETRARGAPQLFRRHLKPQKLHRDQNNPLHTFFHVCITQNPKQKHIYAQLTTHIMTR